MALTLIKEDGTGRSDANSYASTADGDGYHDGHLYAGAWTGATPDRKAAALVFATRLIDSQFQFNGGRVKPDQALQWPRQHCPDPDSGEEISFVWWRTDRCVAIDVVPKSVVNATCEMARELLILDRTAAPPGEGISSTFTDVGGTTYSKKDTRPILSYVTQAMLAKFGALVSGGSGAVPLVRA
jgi:hypothetical protein